MEVFFFNTHIPRFISQELEASSSRRLLKTIALLERYGSLLREPFSKHIRGALFELRAHGSTSVRAIFTFYRGNAVILHVFVKKSNRVPDREIHTASLRLRRLVE